MHNFKKIAKIMVALLLAITILFGLDFMLYPCTFMRNDIHTVTTEKRQDIFLGTSHGKMNIDPETVGEITEKTGHNLCVGGEYGVDAYHLAKLVIEKQAPERIIYENDPGYFATKKEPGNNYLLFYHEFPLSVTKFEYFKEILLECDFRTVLFPWYEYSLKYEVEKLSDTIYQKMNHNYDVSYLKGKAQEYHESGFIERYPIDTSRLTLTEPKLFSRKEVKKENMEYLGKLIQLCKENNIEFVAVTTPIPDELLKEYSKNFEEAWDYFSDYFEKQNVQYINFNREQYDLFSHELSNFTDYDGHMNGEAAIRFSKILGYLLKEY